MSQIPCEFDKIHPNSGDSTPCTPSIDDESFRGIRINGPTEVFFDESSRDRLFGGFARVIVAGACQFKYPTLGLRGRWGEHVVTVAVDSKTKQVYSGRMAKFGNPLPPLDPLKGTDATPDDFANVLVGSYFNVNLVTSLHIPERDAEYDVYSVLGPYKSNVIHIKVSRKR